MKGAAARGLLLWLGAAVLSSFGVTLTYHLAFGGELSAPTLRMALGLALMPLIFTLAGSGLLVLVFAWMGRWPLPLILRYALLLLFGGAAGAAVMLPFATSTFILAGLAYGTATAFFWVFLHLAIYRGQ